MLKAPLWAGAVNTCVPGPPPAHQHPSGKPESQGGRRRRAGMVHAKRTGSTRIGIVDPAFPAPATSPEALKSPLSPYNLNKPLCTSLPVSGFC